MVNNYLYFIFILVLITVVYFNFNRETFLEKSISDLLSRGSDGVQGEEGLRGTQGVQGLTGPVGEDGKSALNMILEPTGPASRARDTFEIKGSTADSVLSNLVDYITNEIIINLDGNCSGDSNQGSVEFDGFSRNLITKIVESIDIENEARRNTTSAAPTTTAAPPPDRSMDYMIVPYCGKSNRPPDGWQICDGSLLTYENININVTPRFTTPDLRGRFTLASGSVSLSDSKIDANNNEDNGKEGTHGILAADYNLNETTYSSHGTSVTGETFTKLNGTQLPEHRHGGIHLSIAPPDGFSGYGLDTGFNDSQAVDDDNIFNGHRIIEAEPSGTDGGGGEKHNNMPPFLILMYIIKQPYHLTSDS